MQISWKSLFMLFCVLFVGIKELNVEPYDEDDRTGHLRYVQVTSPINIYWIPIENVLLIATV